MWVIGNRFVFDLPMAVHFMRLIDVSGRDFLARNPLVRIRTARRPRINAFGSVTFKASREPKASLPYVLMEKAGFT